MYRFAWTLLIFNRNYSTKHFEKIKNLMVARQRRFRSRHAFLSSRCLRFWKDRCTSLPRVDDRHSSVQHHCFGQPYCTWPEAKRAPAPDLSSYPQRRARAIKGACASDEVKWVLLHDNRLSPVSPSESSPQDRPLSRRRHLSSWLLFTHLCTPLKAEHRPPKTTHPLLHFHHCWK